MAGIIRSKKETEMKKTTKEPAWGPTYSNIPPGLKAGKAIKAAKEEEAKVAAEDARKPVSKGAR
jgi:hypothetical protein